MKAMWFRLVLVVLIMVVGLVSFPASMRVAQAQELSEGCEFVNSPFFDDVYNFATITSRQYNAGEQIIVSAGLPTSEGWVLDQIMLIVYTDVELALVSSPFPGTVTYTFSSSQAVKLHWRVNPSLVPVQVPTATWEVTCIGSEHIPGETVPTNPSTASEQANSHACGDNPGRANEHRPSNLPPCSGN